MDRILTILLVILFACCSESEKNKVLRIVKEWDGKEMKFPKNPVFTIRGTDTVDMDCNSSSYKIVSYVADSEECSSCKLQLNRWKDFIAEMDTIVPCHLTYLFFIHSEMGEEIALQARREDFNYPVCLDSGGELNRLNHFPPGMSFHTFLLDESNKVIAIGNPILNPKVKLFIERLVGKQKQENRLFTTIEVNRLENELGRVKLSDEKICSFTVTNTGHNPFVIYDVITSCGCIKVDYAKMPTKPSDTVRLSVTFNAEKTGYFNKTLLVYCNIQDGPIRLRVSGTVENK